MTSELPPEQTIARALRHPLRARILRLLALEEASPVELARSLDERLGNVSYHVKVLNDLGLIELTRTTPRRGALEHHYRARVLTTSPESDWSGFSKEVRQSAVGQLLWSVGQDVQEAVARGDFSPEQAHVESEDLILDKQGVRELRRAMRQLQTDARRIARQSERRGRTADAATQTTKLAMLLLDTKSAH